MKLNKYLILSGLVCSMGMTSCVGDLNVEPTNPTSKIELTSREEYLGELAAAYNGLAKEGGITSGATGGESIYTRILFNLEELPTDECFICGNWNDAGIDDLCFAVPASDNHWIYDMFSRLNAYIAVCNQFIRDIDGAGEFFTDAEITEMKAEARVLRNLGYYHMIDLFGRGPWTTENSIVGATPPTYNRTQLFEATVADLIDAIPQVNPASQQEYGRVSREAAYALLAKLYLNAGVYTGTPMWEECANACKEVIKSGKVLADDYKYLFCGSNHNYVACSTYGADGEILWSVPQNDLTMQSYGGTTYLSGGAYSASISDEMMQRLGVGAAGWQGPHMRPETVNNFTPNDERALFYGDIFQNDLNNIAAWGDPGTSGYMCIKYVYTNEDDYYNESGTSGSSTIFNSADFPLFRLADIYLMLAECELNGVACDGLEYYNKVRTRAGVDAVGYYSADDLLAERNRELYWEGHRRSDLIRFGKYTGATYNWQWKGGVQAGTGLDSYRNLMPIPPQFVSTLGQNPGY